MAEQVRARLVAVLATVVGVGVAMVYRGPMRVAPRFHVYADGRTLLGIPNALDVLSNLAFVAVGLLGLVRLARARRAGAASPVVPAGALWLLYASIVAIGVGSGVYHALPRDATLLWDFVPIAVTFMGFVSVETADRVDRRAGELIMLPLVVLGAGSAFYWYAGTAWFGGGDMRWYVMIQATGVIVAALLLLVFPRGRMPTRDVAIMLGCYLVARVFAGADAGVLAFTRGLASGHTVKHLVAALATWFLVRATVHLARPQAADAAPITRRSPARPAPTARTGQ